MKQLTRWMYLGPFSAGILFAEYEILHRVGGLFVVFALACAFATIAGVLWRAPQGHERADGFHIGARKRSTGFVPAVRPPPEVRRGWT